MSTQNESSSTNFPMIFTHTQTHTCAHDLFDRDSIYVYRVKMNIKIINIPPLTRNKFGTRTPYTESIICVHRLHTTIRYRFNYCYYVVINYRSVGSPHMHMYRQVYLRVFFLYVLKQTDWPRSGQLLSDVKRPYTLVGSIF